MQTTISLKVIDAAQLCNLFASDFDVCFKIFSHTLQIKDKTRQVWVSTDWEYWTKQYNNNNIDFLIICTHISQEIAYLLPLPVLSIDKHNALCIQQEVSIAAV